MHHIILHQQISRLLEKITGQHDAITAQESKVPQIEIDILLSDIRALYETVKRLEQNNALAPTPENEKATTPHSAPVISEEDTVNGKALQATPEPSSSGIEKSFARAGEPTVGSRYKEEPTLHDRITKTAVDNSLGSKLQKKPIRDLKSAIGINEKFIFISELFDGNQQEFIETVETLNKCSRLDVALTHIGIIRTKYSWNEENKPVKDFMELVERRFL
jgi:hypothetical protein